MDGFTSAEEMRKWEIKNNVMKMVDIYFVSGEYYSEDQVINDLKLKVGIKNENGIRCLRKPVDVSFIKNIVEKYKSQ